MTPLHIYIAAVAFGNLAYWRTGLMRWLFWNHHARRVDWPDPVDVPVFLAFLLSPLPGLLAVGDFLLAVREKLVGHETGNMTHNAVCGSRMDYK